MRDFLFNFLIELIYNILMKIEVEQLISTGKNSFLWDMKGSRGMEGGDTKITLDNGKAYEFNVQDFMFYVIHRSYGSGSMKNCKK